MNLDRGRVVLPFPLCDGHNVGECNSVIGAHYIVSHFFHKDSESLIGIFLRFKIYGIKEQKQGEKICWCHNHTISLKHLSRPQLLVCWYALLIDASCCHMPT